MGMVDAVGPEWILYSGMADHAVILTRVTSMLVAGVSFVLLVKPARSATI
jgi:hypothetical protein